MTVSFIDDIANRRLISEVLVWADEGDDVPLARLHELARGKASARDAERFGEHWTESLVDLLQRGGVGQLERRADGELVFAFAGLPPTPEEAWERATGLGG